MHSDQLGTAFLTHGKLHSCGTCNNERTIPYLVCAGDTAEYRAPGLSRLVPGGDGLPSQGAHWGVHHVEVENTRRRFLEEFAAAMA
jgi:hypothetical protein